MGGDKSQDVLCCLFHRITLDYFLRLGIDNFEHSGMRDTTNREALSVFRGKRLTDIDRMVLAHRFEKHLNAGIFHGGIPLSKAGK